MSFNTNTNKQSVFNFNYFDMGNSSPEKVANLVRLLSSQPVVEQESTNIQIKVEPKVDIESKADTLVDDVKIIEIPKPYIEVIKIEPNDNDEKYNEQIEEEIELELLTPLELTPTKNYGQIIEIKQKHSVSVRNGNGEQMNEQKPVKIYKNWEEITGDEEVTPYLGTESSSLMGTGFEGGLGYSFINETDNEVKLTDEFKVPKLNELDKKYHFLKETGNLGIFNSRESEFLKQLVDVESKLKNDDKSSDCLWSATILDLIHDIKEKMGYNQQAVEKVRELVTEMKANNPKFDNNKLLSDNNLNAYMNKYLARETKLNEGQEKSTPIHNITNSSYGENLKQNITISSYGANLKQNITNSSYGENLKQLESILPMLMKKKNSSQITEESAINTAIILDGITETTETTETTEEPGPEDYYSESVHYGLNIKYYNKKELEAFDKCLDELNAMENGDEMMIDEDIVNSEARFVVKKKNAIFLSDYRKDGLDIKKRHEENIKIDDFKHLFTDKVLKNYLGSTYRDAELKKLREIIGRAVYMLGMTNICEIKINETWGNGWKSTLIFELLTKKMEKFQAKISCFNLDIFTPNVFSDELYEIVQNTKTKGYPNTFNSEDRYRIGTVLKELVCQGINIYAKRVCRGERYLGSYLYKVE